MEEKQHNEDSHQKTDEQSVSEHVAEPRASDSVSQKDPQGTSAKDESDSNVNPKHVRGSVKEGRRRPEGRQNRRREPEPSEFMEKVLSIKRVTKVTKGGKKLSFSALVVVGDTKGKVGYSLSKAGEVATAIRKALTTAKKNMVSIPLKETTIPHEIIGVCGGAEVLLKPASEGTGVIASGPVRAVCDGAGIHNILTKCHRSNNPINVVKATMDGLMRLKTKIEKPQPEAVQADTLADKTEHE